MFWSLTPAFALAPPPSEWVTSEDPAFASLSEWSNKVELGDLDGDGDLDVVIPNGGDYSTGGDPEPTRLLLNDGLATFTELALPETFGLHRAAKVRDFDGDGAPDLFLAGAWLTPSVLLLGDGAGGFVDGSVGLPLDPLAVGDVEAGDVDDDGDLDLVLADSGPGNALTGDGAYVRLWRNDGSATFTDDSQASLPLQKVRWSWDLELVDVDADLDLDLAISCKTCSAQFLWTNDGGGVYVDASTSMPPATNNYDFEGLDLTGDGWVDLVTINDGPGLRERILVNDGAGGFVDETAARLPNDQNPGADDNVVVLFDHDQDGDVDIAIGSLSGDDRILANDGAGNFTAADVTIEGPDTPGTLGLAVGDLNGDHRPDLVDVQGEAAFRDYLRLGVGIPADAVAPFVGAPAATAELGSQPFPVRVVAHDHTSPITPEQLVVTLKVTPSAGGEVTLPM
ncbi:MAG: VCBS repeat-containing protein, partial [Myxococcota bacterium]